MINNVEITESTNVLDIKNKYLETHPNTNIKKLILFNDKTLLTDDINVNTLFVDPNIKTIVLRYIIAKMQIEVDPFNIEESCAKDMMISVKIDSKQYYLHIGSNEIWDYYSDKHGYIQDEGGNIIKKLGDDNVVVIRDEEKSTDDITYFKVIVYYFPEINHEFGVFPSTDGLNYNENIDFTYEAKGRLNGEDCVAMVKFKGYQPNCEICDYPTAWEVYDYDELEIVDLNGNNLDYQFVVKEDSSTGTHHTALKWHIVPEN